MLGSVSTDSKAEIQFFAEALHKACVSFKCHLILYNGAWSGFEEADRLFALLSAEGSITPLVNIHSKKATTLPQEIHYIPLL